MKSSASSEQGTPGRPAEIEAPTNRWLVHPVSRAIVDKLVTTRATPNQVSAASVLAAAGGAASYLWIPRPVGPCIALLFLWLWHVLDGADGELARRTGRASTNGELVDGLCDHLSQLLIYLAFALILSRQVGPIAWAVAAIAGLCHFVQANAYESGRKSYRRWRYGATWMRQNLASLERSGAIRGLLGRMYVRLSSTVSGGEEGVEEAMSRALGAGGERSEAARLTYGNLLGPEVRASGLLDSNVRTVVGFLSLLVGSPIWYFLFEIVVLDLALIWLGLWRARANRRLVAELS
ncbi:MAG: CDP-alcohol phosphatidyltransferase family protein [Caulobacteraceae bacterium]